jgi:hypothetical protein
VSRVRRNQTKLSVPPAGVLSFAGGLAPPAEETCRGLLPAFELAYERTQRYFQTVPRASLAEQGCEEATAATREERPEGLFVYT